MLLRLFCFLLSLCVSSSSSLPLFFPNISALARLSSWFNCLSSSNPLCSFSLQPLLLFTFIPHSSFAALSAHSCQTIFLPSSFSLSAKLLPCPAFASLVIFFLTLFKWSLTGDSDRFYFQVMICSVLETSKQREPHYYIPYQYILTL